MDLGISGVENAEPVGKGGFATVYQARQPAFARTVAVKVLSGTDFDDDRRLHVERELQALGLLSEHPGIVSVHDTGFTTDGRPYSTMAFVSGGSLADRISTRGALPWPEVAAITIGLAGALETAHWSGIVHGDIKPANVLLARDGAQLSDFGIASIAGEHETQSGLVTASVLHGAPEVLGGNRPTVAADVYSLGSTAYAMLLGKSPFEPPAGREFAATVQRIQTETPPDLRDHGVPAAVAALLEATLAKDPAERPGSALEFGQRLQDVMRAEGHEAPELILAPEVVADVEVSREQTTRRPAASKPAASKPAVSKPAASKAAASETRRPKEAAVVSGVPAKAEVADDPPDRRRRLAGLIAVGGLVVGGLAGAAIAGGGDGADGGNAGNGEAATTVNEPPATEAAVVTTPDAETPTGTDEPNEAEAPTTLPEATLPTTASSPISDEPVCGNGDGLLASDGQPVQVILDTGIGLGIDDLGALAMLHALTDVGEAEILATMVSAGGDPAAGQTVDAVNTYYGRPDLPVGVVSGPAPSGTSPYTAAVAGGFPNDLVDPPAAVDLYRQVLAGQPDGSVTIVSGGFLTNLADLLASPPDEASDLTGEELVAAKVVRWVAIGGAYPRSEDILQDAEFNFAQDTPAAQSAVSAWPTPVVFSGFEVGSAILTATTLQTETPVDNPVREGYRLWGAIDGFQSYDLTAVLVAVRGTAGDTFEVCTGRNIVGDGGVTTWENRADGTQGYLRTLAPNDEISATLDELLTAPPAI